MPASEGNCRVTIPPGNCLVTLTAEGYRRKTIFLQAVKDNILLEEKLEKEGSSLRQFAEIGTGRQPKSIAFSPDGTLMFTALLDGHGIDVFSTKDFRRVKKIIIPEPYGSKRGFVEIEFLPRHHELWVSQMTTGMVHAISLHNLEYTYSIPTRGLWPKVIIADKEENKAYISNWVSHDISVVDIDTRETTALIHVGGTPRGLALSKNQDFLYVCLYDTGNIEKINLSNAKVVKSIRSDGGSKRHILLDPATNYFYVSDMYWGSVYVLSGDTDSIIRKIPIDHNPNTIALTSDGSVLFISTRGPNHPETYLRKGPRFGKIYVMDTATFEIQDWIWGKNQPTGLALSPDNRFMAYSNFLDASLEVYWTGLN